MSIVRNFRLTDIEESLKIYNYYIINGLGNFEEIPLSFEEFSILCENILNANLPFVVCEKDNKIVGLSYLNKFRNKSGYRFSYENTIYIDNNYLGLGLGDQLLKRLIAISQKNPKIKTIIAVIGGHNSEASIKNHEKNGFRIVGTLKKVGYKKNKWLDSIYMQKILNEKN